MVIGVRTHLCTKGEYPMAAANLQLILAGATVNRIPVMEIPTGDAEGTVDTLKS